MSGTEAPQLQVGDRVESTRADWFGGMAGTVLEVREGYGVRVSVDGFPPRCSDGSLAPGPWWKIGEFRTLEPDDTETICRRCRGPNVSWSAPSPLWNAVMRGGSINGPLEYGELICPTCFLVLAEERGIACAWKVSAEIVHVELETVTPSGRVWDEESGLWKDPA